MRTRYKRYDQYGLSKSDVESVFFWLNNSITPAEAKKLKQEIQSRMPEYVSHYIYQALTEKKGYTPLVKHEGLCMLAEDFYGYKRKGVWIASENKGR